ncbi:MAG: hypothetical protein H6718_06000 [Polyangiaceae bacterium]|nr:hypothetical protein [Myxococcales bacterium]MCB9584929.1 hypothetical protein [Polyangiaceae bacterium]MCB9607498.1 hypothetical protein [Polyangiaceae bacterium]
MTELDSWSKDLILAAKGADDPSDAQRARLRASLLAATAGAGIAGAGMASAGVAGGSAAGVATTTAKTALWLKLLLSVVSVGAVTGIGYSVYSAATANQSPPPEAQATTAAPALQPAPKPPEPPVEALAATSEAPSETEEPPKPATAAPKAVAPAKSAGKPGLAEEVALISRTRSAVQSGNAADAQRLLAQHRREFPRGSLSLERSGLELILACRSGGGKSQAKAFLKRYGKTPIAGSVRSACGISE